jgi:hypothetical protein
MGSASIPGMSRVNTKILSEALESWRPRDLVDQLKTRDQDRSRHGYNKSDVMYEIKKELQLIMKNLVY